MAAGVERLATGMKIAGIGGSALMGGALPYVGGAVAIASLGPRFVGTIKEGKEALKQRHGRAWARNQERRFFIGKKVLRGEEYGDSGPGWVLAIPLTERWIELDVRDKNHAIMPFKVMESVTRQQYLIEPQLTYGIARRTDNEGNRRQYYFERPAKDGSTEKYPVPYSRVLRMAVTGPEDTTELGQAVTSTAGSHLLQVIRNRLVVPDATVELDGDELLHSVQQRCGQRLLQTYGVELRQLNFFYGENNVFRHQMDTPAPDGWQHPFLTSEPQEAPGTIPPYLIPPIVD